MNLKLEWVEENYGSICYQLKCLYEIFKKPLKYEILKSFNLFESESNIDINLTAFTVLKSDTKLLDAKHLVADLTWQQVLPLKLGYVLRPRVLGLPLWYLMKNDCFVFLVMVKFS